MAALYEDALAELSSAQDQHKMAQMQVQEQEVRAGWLKGRKETLHAGLDGARQGLEAARRRVAELQEKRTLMAANTTGHQEGRARLEKEVAAAKKMVKAKESKAAKGKADMAALVEERDKMLQRLEGAVQKLPIYGRAMRTMAESRKKAAAEKREQMQSTVESLRSAVQQNGAEIGQAEEGLGVCIKELQEERQRILEEEARAKEVQMQSPGPKSPNVQRLTSPALSAPAPEPIPREPSPPPTEFPPEIKRRQFSLNIGGGAGAIKRLTLPSIRRQDRASVQESPKLARMDPTLSLSFLNKSKQTLSKSPAIGELSISSAKATETSQRASAVDREDGTDKMSGFDAGVMEVNKASSEFALDFDGGPSAKDIGTGGDGDGGGASGRDPFGFFQTEDDQSGVAFSAVNLAGDVGSGFDFFKSTFGTGRDEKNEDKGFSFKF